jgi:hypothetical protein
VHINAVDLEQSRGVGWIDGVDAPVSFRRVQELICAGGYQQVLLGENGNVLYLGCTIPARWAKCTTSHRGSRTGPPTSTTTTTTTTTTAHFCAGITTTRSTPLDGRSAWSKDDPRYWGHCSGTLHKPGGQPAPTAPTQPAPAGPNHPGAPRLRGMNLCNRRC